MTDEQRGQSRPAGDVAQHATGAGESSPTTANLSGAPAADGPTVAAARPAAGRGSMYGTPGYPQFASAYGGQYLSSPQPPGPGPQQGPSAGEPPIGRPLPPPNPPTSAYGAPQAAPGGDDDPPHFGGRGGAAPHEEQPPPGQRGLMGKVVAAALIAGLVGGGAGFGGAYALLGSGTGGTASPTLSSSPASSSSDTPALGSIAAAAAKATPSTVDIRVQLAQGVAEGSGVILTADGDVLTNNHVVSGSTGQIRVTLSDGSTHSATVVGTSPSYDLAVIRIEGVSGLTAATLGRSEDVKVGQQVVAIGSPQGLSGTVTTGIVSALNRTVEVSGESAGSASVVYNGLQTDAPINQGNSGGPLVNLDGQVIGINSAIATAGSSTGSIGLGFAIPIDQARRVAQEIIDTGKATKPVLGVQGSTAASSASATGGATLAGIVAGGPAEAAGLQQGDVVTKVGDAIVSDFSDLVARVGSYAPGDQVTLTYTRGGQTQTATVTLGSTDDTGATTSSGGSSQQGGGSFPFDLSPFGQQQGGG